MAENTLKRPLWSRWRARYRAEPRRRCFAERGYRVAIADLSKSGADATACLFRALRRLSRALGAPCLRQVVKRFGRLDALVTTPASPRRQRPGRKLRL